MTRTPTSTATGRSSVSGMGAPVNVAHASPAAANVETPEGPRLPPQLPLRPEIQARVDLASRLMEPDSPEWAEVESQLANAAQERAEASRSRLEVQLSEEPPPSRTPVTNELVHEVLVEIFGSNAARYMPESAADSTGLFVELEKFYTPLLHSSLLPGIFLEREGRELLASHYRETTGARIVIHQIQHVEKDGEESQGSALGRQVAELVKAERELARKRVEKGQSGDMRRVYYLDDDSHARLVIYMREGPKEALMAFDSMAGGSMEIGLELAGCKEWLEATISGPGDKAIPVYELTVPVQIDRNSCWLFAMSAAAKLGGRHPDGEYFFPSLIDELDSRRIRIDDERPSQLDIIPVWAPREIARLAQDANALLKHTGEEFDLPLRGSRPDKTLRTHVQKFNRNMRTLAGSLSAGQERDFIVSDYIRRKGESAANTILIKAASRRIGKKVEAQREAGEALSWGPQQAAEFEARLKAKVRAPKAVEPADFDQIEKRIRELPVNGLLKSAFGILEDLNALRIDSDDFKHVLGALSDAGWDEAMRHVVTVDGLLWKLSVEFDRRLAEFKKLNANDKVAIGTAKIFEPLFSKELKRVAKKAHSDLPSLQYEKEYVEELRVLRKALAENPRKWHLPERIAQIWADAPGPLEVVALQVLDEIEATRPRIDTDPAALKEVSTEQLKEVIADLELHKLLFDDWAAQGKKVVKSLVHRGIMGGDVKVKQWAWELGDIAEKKRAIDREIRRIESEIRRRLPGEP